MTTCTASFPLLTMGPLQPPAGMVGCVVVLSARPDPRLETAVMRKVTWLVFCSHFVPC